MLPQLLNWQAAAIAAGVVIPSLLLLYFLKLRRVPQPVGSTILWKKAVQDLQVNSPFQRLRRNLLLLLQLLVLAALLLAFARPVSEGEAVAGDKSVILIDRSASMTADDGEGGSRLDEAKDRAKRLIGTMGRGDQATVIAFDDTAQVLQPFTGDAALLRAAVDDITPSDRPTRLRTAYTLADANMGANITEDSGVRDDPNERADVFLFSDGRVPPAEAIDLSVRGRLVFEQVGTADVDNLAIVAASVKRNYEQPGEAQAFVRVANFGTQPAEAGVKVRVAELDETDLDAPLAFEPVTSLPALVSVPPERWTDEAYLESLAANDPAAADEIRQSADTAVRRDGVDITLNLPRAAVVRVELVRSDDYDRAIDDALAADDVAYVVVPPPEPLSVLLVTEGNYFLQNLIETQGLDDPRTVSPEGYAELVAGDEAANVDVTIFDGHTPASLPDAGTFIWTGALPPAGTTQVAQVTNDVGVGLFYEGNGVLDWEREHPMLRGLLLNRLWVADGRLLALPLGAQQLIEGERGPLLVLERNGPRTHLIFSFDLVQSTWPRLKTFPYFAYQMFEFLAASEDVRIRESVRPGQVVGVPRSALDRGNLTGGDELRVIGPIGSPGIASDTRTRTLDAAGGITLGPFEHVGVYRTEPALPQFERVAVSLLDPSESNLMPADPAVISLGGVQAIDDPDATGVAGALRGIEWWWWLVAAAAGLLLVEWFVYTRRVAA
jgi:hypothetical protein